MLVIATVTVSNLELEDSHGSNQSKDGCDQDGAMDYQGSICRMKDDIYVLHTNTMSWTFVLYYYPARACAAGVL